MFKFKCEACTYECNYKEHLKRHKEHMHEGVRYLCSLCSMTFSFVSSLSRHLRNIHGIDANRKSYQSQVAAQNNDEDNVPHERVRHLCDLCNSTFHNPSNLSRHIRIIHGIDEYQRRYKRHVAAQDRVRHSCNLCSSTFSIRCSLLRHIRTIHGIDTNHRGYKSPVTTQENVPDIRSESYVIDISSDSEDGEICMNPLNEDSCTTSPTAVNVEKTPIDNSVGTKTTRFNLCPRNQLGIDTNHRGYKSPVTTQENVPDIRSESSVIDISSDSEDGEICMNPLNEDLCTTSPTAVNVEKTPIDNSVGTKTTRFNLRPRNQLGIDTNHRGYKSPVTTQENVPDIRSESYVIDISSDSEDGEICMNPLNEDSCTTSPTAVNVEKTPIDNSVGTKTTRFNLCPRNQLGVVRQNEYLCKGVLNNSTKNQSFSTPKKSCILRKLHEEYVKVENVQDRRLAWASHATSLSQKLNLELKVIGFLMLDILTDYSTPIDENLIQMLHQNSLFCVENIQHHTQYYIFVQLVYGLMKVYEIDSEDLQRHRKSNWMKNTITILEYFKFTDDTADFMIERMENFI